MDDKLVQLYIHLRVKSKLMPKTPAENGGVIRGTTLDMGYN